MLHSLKSLRFLLFFVFVSVWPLTSANAPVTLYKAKGEDVVLDPQYSAPPITSIQWKHGSDIAAEGEGGDPEYFRQFKGRCKLDYSTGALTITGLNGSENGIFSVEINNKQTDTKILLSVISKVPKPTITSQCDPDVTNCTLTCDGDTADAEPCNCTWFVGGVQRGLDRELKITEDTKEESFTCMLQNPVSTQTSESFSNPIIINNKRENNQMASIIVPVVLILLALIAGLVGLIIFIIRKRKARSHDIKQDTKEENKAMLPKEDLVLQPPNVAYVSEVRQESNQSPAPAVTSNGVGGSAHSEARGEPTVLVHAEQNDGNGSEEAPVTAETSNQDPESSESPDTSKETGNTSGTGETPDQDLTVPESLNTSKETGNTSGTGETPDQDLTVPESLNTSKETGNSAATSDNQESTNHEPALVGQEADVD